MAMKLDHDDLNRLIERISTSDIQEFSLEGEDFKLEIKRNVFDHNQVINNLVPNTTFDKQQLLIKKLLMIISLLLMSLKNLRWHPQGVLI